MANQVTVLVENTVRKVKLLAEHGLVLWIEYNGGKFLFDTGQGQVLAHNVRQLGIPLETVDAILLSHGHCDHSNGVWDVLQTAGRTPLYAHPGVFEEKFAAAGRRIGMPHREELRRGQQAELTFTESPTEVAEGFRLTGPVPRVTSFEDTGGKFYLDAGAAQPDELLDDQSAFLETPQGTAVICGCAHSGVINTLRYIQELTDGRPIHTLIGGMHLINASEERISRTIDALREMDIQRIFPMHCTGFEASARLWDEFPGRVQIVSVGAVISLED